ncbi:hypothetical protein [Flavobacterium helocola]|uniref:SMODS and SLOG-associating 2TM effector domain-containing protein n=1 Tax=Flavobacterium helocola TaxID=3139139 RepID=A0ABU9IB81_9FLAO
MILFEDLIKYIESIIVLFTIPYAYLESQESKFEKINNAINTLSDLVLYRLSKKSFISNHELESLRKSYLRQSNLSLKSLYIDDILDNAINKIETNPFISINERRKLYEKINILKQNKNSIWINVYRFLKNNKTKIFTYVIIIIALITFIFPEKWNVFKNLEQYKRYSIQLGISLFITFFAIIIYKVYILLFKNAINEGFYQLDPSSFKFLPDYYNEHISFKSNDKLVKLDLIDVDYKILRKQVESDSGCLSLGVIKFYKELPEYKLIFKSNKNFKLEIIISKKSIINGSINLDKITYRIVENNEVNEKSFYHSQNKEDLKEIDSDFTKFNNLFSIVEGFKCQINNNIVIVLNNEMQLKGIKIKNEFYTIN